MDSRIIIGERLCRVDLEKRLIVEIDNPKNRISIDDLDLIHAGSDYYYYRGYFDPDTGNFQKAALQDNEVRFRPMPNDYFGVSPHSVPLNPLQFTIPHHYIDRGYLECSLEAHAANNVFPKYCNFKLIDGRQQKAIEEKAFRLLGAQLPKSPAPKRNKRGKGI